MMPPGCKWPRAAASSMMLSAARSLTLPPGLRNSALPKMVQPVSRLGPASVTSGVLPISAMISGTMATMAMT
jgi:hypothetical protein